ncbi:MAG TPA: 50S ribosomal protein L20 [Tepidisphaeraceae bacterium]|nr:50S ribosomal protein L20 [Tepidisphaeraceae bacterium]
MPRTKGGVTHARKRKRVLKRASGFTGTPGSNYRIALEFTLKADKYAYRDRRQKKRHFRSLWVTRLNAALKERGVQYSRFIPAAIAAGITLNRKMLSELAVSDPKAFDAIVALVKPHITGPAKKELATA